MEESYFGALAMYPTFHGWNVATTPAKELTEAIGRFMPWFRGLGPCDLCKRDKRLSCNHVVWLVHKMPFLSAAQAVKRIDDLRYILVNDNAKEWGLFVVIPREQMVSSVDSKS